MEIECRTKDHPEANGRVAQSGDVAWTIEFALEDGSKLVIRMGRKARDIVFGMLIADCCEAGEPEPEAKPKRFPMQGGPAIDWEAAEEAYKDYVYIYGNIQSLERIAERGGFGWGEVALVRSEADAKRRRRGEKR